MSTTMTTPGKRKRQGNTDVETSICFALRKVQRLTGCTNQVLRLTIKNLAPFFKEKIDAEACFRRSSRTVFDVSGASFLKLNGCVGCHRHVFLPSSKFVRCPECQHPRFKANLRPNEVSSCNNV
jgi:hypothetical protein